MDRFGDQNALYRSQHIMELLAIFIFDIADISPKCPFNVIEMRERKSTEL